VRSALRRQPGGRGRSRFGLNPSQKSPLMAGFCNSMAGLQAPNLRCSRPKMAKVSGHSLKNSRFPETPAGDWVRSALGGRAYSGIQPSPASRKCEPFIDTGRASSVLKNAYGQAPAQQNLSVIGFPSSKGHADSTDLMPFFHQGLSEVGYVSGATLPLNRVRLMEITAGCPQWLSIW
jgi:hypothetical protein